MSRVDPSELGLSKIRSGRFRVKADTQVIKVSNKVAYRVFNSGTAPFGFEQNTEVVAPRGSIDLLVDRNLTVQPTAGESAVGIYEHLLRGSPVRPGKIYVTEDTNVTIVSRQPDSLYRILNSGRKMFRITTDGVSVELSGRREEPRSVDVFTSSGTIVIETTGQKPDPLSPYEGVYENVDLQPLTRPGRFSIQGKTLPKETERNIIALGKHGFVRNYRFINTGEHPFEIEDTEASSKITLAGSCSIDLKVIGAVWVRATQKDHDVKGIYFTI